MSKARDIADSNLDNLTVDTNTLVIDSTNNRVGIGTSSPDKALTISASDSQVRLYDADGTNQFASFQSDNGTAKITSRNNTSHGTIAFQRYNGTTVAESMRIDSSGNVGIGTTSTGTYTLAVDSQSKGISNAEAGIYTKATRNGVTWGLVSNNTYTSTDTGTGIKFTSGDFDTGAIIVRADGTASSGDAAGYMTFHTSNNASEDVAERMRIDSSGNVGIGTSSPEHALSVFKDSNGNRTEIGIDNIDQRLVLGAYFESGVGQYSTIQSTNNAENSALSLVLQPDGGNVGIGTSSPSQKLHVSGGQILLNNGSDFYINSGPTDSYLYTLNTNLLFFTNTNERMRITTGGNVGIGTSSPNSKLHVKDSTDIAMSNSADGQFVIEGNGYSGAIALNATGMQIYQNSSARNIIFGNNETEQMRITAGGLVGIGTSSPVRNLDINSSDSNSRARFTNTSTGAGSGSDGLDLGMEGINAIFWNRENGLLRFGTNNTERMRINAAGRVDVNDSLLVYNNLEVGAGAGTHGKINSQTPGTFEYFIDKGLSYRGVCDGSFGGYLLLVPAYTSGTVVGKKFYGEIIADRGNTGNGNSTSWAKVLASTAYNNDKLFLKVMGSSQYFTATHKVTYSGTQYLALRFNVSGGGPVNSFHAKGHVMGEDGNFLFMARDSEVSNVISFGTRILDI